MQRITHATATVDNRFTEGSPTAGTPATVVTADWLNGIQEELVSVIAAAGIALNAGSTVQLLAAIRALTMPVGHIVHLYVDSNPSALYGFGTWVEIAQGRVLVGRNGSDPDFDVIGDVGGAKTHTLLTTEMPGHQHFVANVDSAPDSPLAVGTVLARTDHNGGDLDYQLSGTSTAATVGQSSSTGGGAAHNNLQPYLVCRIWRRSA